MRSDWPFGRVHLGRCTSLLVGALAFAGLSTGCGGGSAEAKFGGDDQPKVEAKMNADGSIDDRSMCEWRGRQDREATETAGPGAIMPNVRRVWAVVGTDADRQKILVCREIDTNLDGVKDVVRHYNDKGESLKEQADSNYDGRLDTWITFAKGRLAEVRIDADYDGNPDEWKFYSHGKLSRIKRDTNKDGKPDVWEIYRKGQLERMGVDIDGDERVDRWDHDADARRDREAQARRDEEEEERKEAEKSEDPNAERYSTDGTN